MKDPNPNEALQQLTAELYADASATKNSFEHVLPSKKKTWASQGLGAGVTGKGVGSGVTGEGDGGSVLQIST